SQDRVSRRKVRWRSSVGTQETDSCGTSPARTAEVLLSAQTAAAAGASASTRKKRRPHSLMHAGAITATMKWRVSNCSMYRPLHEVQRQSGARPVRPAFVTAYRALRSLNE